MTDCLLPAQHFRDLAKSAIDSDAKEPFGLYVFGPEDPGSELAVHVERSVFAEAFGNAPLLLDDEYAAYQRSSLFLCVIDHRRCLPAGMMRILLPSPVGFKSVHDIARVWSADPQEVFENTSIAPDLDRTWDIATLAVVPGYRRGATSGLITVALSQAVFMGAEACSVEWLVAILDTVVLRKLQWQLRRPLISYQGLDPLPYLGSPASLPVYSDVVKWKSSLQLQDPAMHDTLFGGCGLEGAVAPWSLGSLVDAVAGSSAAIS